MKRLFLLLTMLLGLTAYAQQKTLIVYYSFTNNTRRIATDLQAQTGADILEIQPADKGIDYAADNYAVGSALIAAIRENPDDAASYPAIDPVSVDFSAYGMVIVAAPLWWSNMAAPLQTFLFHHGAEMAGKHIGVVVSSAGSGISGVVSDAKRLIPDGRFVEPNLWIRSSQTSNCHSLNAAWLEEIGYSSLTAIDSPTAATAGPTLTVADGRLTVGGAFKELSLYDMTGRRVMQTRLASASVEMLRAGSYVARLLTAEGERSLKLAIQ